MTRSCLHIAHFTNTYLPVMSGVVRSICTFRQAQGALGHNVFIFGQEARNFVDEEPFVFRYPALNIPLRNYPATIPYSPFIDWVLPILKLDVIHAHHPTPMGNAASDKAEKLGVPLVFTHHTRYQEYVQNWGVSEDLVKDVIERQLADYMQKCQHIIAPSPSIKRMIAETYGIQDRLTVLPTGIDLSAWQAADGQDIRQARRWGAEDKVIISIGRLASEKNFAMLLGAVAAVMKQYPQVRLALIGDGPDRKELEELANRLGIGARVEFVGLVPYEDVPRYLKAADIFSFASTTETQGLVTLEAMAADLPVVAVDATGTSDIVAHEVDGLLTANNSQALAAGITRLLQDPALEGRLREGAKAKAQAYEIGNVTGQLIDIYHQAMADKKAGRYVVADKRRPIFQVAWEMLFEKS